MPNNTLNIFAYFPHWSPLGPIVAVVENETQDPLRPQNLDLSRGLTSALHFAQDMLRKVATFQKRPWRTAAKVSSVLVHWIVRQISRIVSATQEHCLWGLRRSVASFRTTILGCSIISSSSVHIQHHEIDNKSSSLKKQRKCLFSNRRIVKSGNSPSRLMKNFGARD